MDTARRNSLIWGSIFTLTALACGWVFGFQPWQQATHHADKVTLSFKALLITPLFLCLGLVMLLPMDPPPAQEQGTPLRGWIFLAILVVGTAGSVAYYFWLRAFLKANGYDL